MSTFTEDLESALAGLDRDLAALAARLGGSFPIHLPEKSDSTFRPAIGYVPSTDTDRTALVAEMATFTSLANAAYVVPVAAPAYGITTSPIAWWRADVLDVDRGRGRRSMAGAHASRLTARPADAGDAADLFNLRLCWWRSAIQRRRVLG